MKAGKESRKVSKLWVGLFGLMIATTTGLQVARSISAGRSDAALVGVECLALAYFGAGLRNELHGSKPGLKAEEPNPPIP